jgi:hypothetical protein
LIDRMTFAREMALLQERFNRELSDPILERYRETLSRHLTTEEFVLAARLAFDTETFWPAPMRLVELVQPSPKAAADQEWERILEAVRRNGQAELSAAGKSALKEVGGTWRIGHSDELTQLPWIKREFVSAFEEFEHRRHADTLRRQLEDGAKQLGIKRGELPS